MVLPARVCLLCGVLLGACGGPAAGPAAPTRTLVAPVDRVAADEAINDVGRRLHAAIAGDAVRSLLLDDGALRSLLNSEAAGRASVLRLNAGAHLRVSEAPRGLFIRSTYAGACVQELRDEPAGGAGRSRRCRMGLPPNPGGRR